MPDTNRTTHFASFCPNWRRGPAKALGAFFLSLLPLLAPGALAGQPFEVEGRVVAVEGGVPRGATVELVAAPTPLELDRVALGELPEPPSPARTGVGPDGSFHLLAPEPGLWIVRIEAPGRVPLEHLPVLLQDLRILDTAVLLPVEELRVVVTDGDGHAVPGAWVEVCPAKEWREHQQRSFQPARRRTVTGEDGAARLVRAVGEEVLVRAFRPDGPESAEVRISGSERAPEDPLAVVLPTGGLQELTVHKADGNPAAGFGVRLGEWGWPAAVTDDEGRARIRVASTKPQLEIVSPAGWTTSVSLTPEAAADPVEIQLPPPVEIIGVVLDWATGEPLAGAWVWSGGERRKVVSPPMTTDRAGGFLLQVAPVTEVQVFAAALGHRPAWFELPVANGQTVNLQIRLPQAVMIRGRVIDGAGRPLGGSDVRVRPATRGLMSWKPDRRMVRVEAGPEGRFRIPVRTADVFDLRAEAQGFAPTVVRRERGDLTEPVELVLRPGASLTGRAVDPDGEPLEGVEISVFEALGNRSYRVNRDRWNLVRGSTTGPEGRFLAEHLPAGIFDVELRGAGRAPRLVHNVDPAPEDGSGLESGEPLDLGDLVLSPGVVLEGRVVGSEGEPVGGGEVVVGEYIPHVRSDLEPPPGLGRREAPTDDEGRFRIEELSSGRRVTVWADGPGHLPDSLQGIELPTEGPVEIRLQRGVRLFGRVLDPEGAPVSGAWVQVSIWREGGRTYDRYESLRSGEGGRFELDAVPRAELSVTVQADGLAPARLQGLSTESGEDVGPLEIRLEAGAVVEGRVLDPTGAPVAGAVLRAAQGIGKDRWAAVPKRSGPGGRFELRGVPVGAVQVTASHGEQQAQEEIDLGPGGAVVDLVLEPVRGLLGRVVDSEGRPVGDAQVAIRLGDAPRGSNHRTARSDPSGRFHFDVEPGEYRVTAFREGFAATEAGPLRVGGDPQRIEIRLGPGVELIGRLTGLASEELSEAYVMTLPRKGGRSLGSPATFDGRYRIPGLTPGVWRVEATVGERVARGTVRIREGEERAVLDLEFSDGYTLSGVVLRNGEPLSDFGLRLIPVQTGVPASITGLFPTTETGADGRFRFRGLEPAEYHLWGSDLEGNWEIERRVEVFSDRETRIEIWATRVTGTVVDAEGEPVNGARVELQVSRLEPGLAFASNRVRTGADGRFVLDTVEEGTWRLILEAEGLGARIEEIRVAGPETDLGTLVLEEGGQVVLEPRWVSGDLPPKIMLMILDPESGMPVAHQNLAVDSDGRARFRGLPSGSWRALVMTEDSVPVHLALDIAEGGSPPPVPVVLEPQTVLRVEIPELTGSRVAAQGVVRGVDGEPFRFFGVARGSEAGTWPVMDGHLLVPPLPAGSWSVEVTAVDGRVWTGAATTRPGEPAVLVLE